MEMCAEQYHKVKNNNLNILEVDKKRDDFCLQEGSLLVAPCMFPQHVYCATRGQWSAFPVTT